MAHSIEWESLRGPPTPRVTERHHPCAPDSLAQDAPARRPHLGHDLRPLHNWRANRAPLEPTSRLTNRHRGRHGPGAAATAPPTLCLWVNRFSVVQSLDRPAGERHTKCRTAGLHPRVGLAKRGPGGALARGAEKENDGSNPQQCSGCGGLVREERARPAEKISTHPRRWRKDRRERRASTTASCIEAVEVPAPNDPFAAIHACMGQRRETPCWPWWRVRPGGQATHHPPAWRAALPETGWGGGERAGASRDRGRYRI